MKKIDLGQKIGVFANLAVLVGVLLLVYELHQNRMMMRAQTRNAIAETLVNYQVSAATSPELQRIQAKSVAGEELTPAELQGFRAYWRGLFRYWENVNYQYRNGLYDDSEYCTQREAWKRILLSNESVLEFWCTRRGIQSAEIDAEFDELLGDAGCK